jgi:serine/threonine protein kinase
MAERRPPGAASWPRRAERDQNPVEDSIAGPHVHARIATACDEIAAIAAQAGTNVVVRIVGDPRDVTRRDGRGLPGDERLARDVAIKVLAAHSTDSTLARERFGREAQAVAAPQHPNICTIDDVGETAEGGAFIVMELQLIAKALEARMGGAFVQSRVLPCGLDLPHPLSQAGGRSQRDGFTFVA